MTAATDGRAGADDLVTAGISVRYYVGGEGEPLLLLHGLAGSAANWVELLPALVRRFRVLALDLPGHAGSATAAARRGHRRLRGRRRRRARRRGRRPALVAGHSFGGLVALRLAQARPELVRGLLLVAPAGISSATRFAQVAGARVGDGAAGPLGRAVALPLRRARVVPPRALPAVVRVGCDSLSAARDARAARRAARARGHEGRRARDGRRRSARRPRRGRCPVVVLWGARDAQLPLDDAFEYARRLAREAPDRRRLRPLVIVERPRAVPRRARGARPVIALRPLGRSTSRNGDDRRLRDTGCDYSTSEGSDHGALRGTRLDRTPVLAQALVAAKRRHRRLRVAGRPGRQAPARTWIWRRGHRRRQDARVVRRSSLGVRDIDGACLYDSRLASC